MMPQIEPNSEHATAYHLGLECVKLRYLVETNWFLAGQDAEFPQWIVRHQETLDRLLESIPASSNVDPFISRAKRCLNSAASEFQAEWMGEEHRRQIEVRTRTEPEGECDLYTDHVPASLDSWNLLGDAIRDVVAHLDETMGLCCLVGQAFADILYVPHSLWASVGGLEGLLAVMLPQLQNHVRQLAEKLSGVGRTQIEVLTLRPIHSSDQSRLSVHAQIACLHNNMYTAISGNSIVEDEFIGGPLGIQYRESSGTLTIHRDGYDQPMSLAQKLPIALFKRIVRREGTCPTSSLLDSWEEVGNVRPESSDRLNSVISTMNGRLGSLGLKIKSVRNEGRYLTTVDV